MNPILLEPTDVLFFRDSVPMAAGQGRGHGCRLPWPSTLHEAFRSTLLLADGDLRSSKAEQGRDLRERSGRERLRGLATPVSEHRRQRGQTSVANTAYQSLRTIGPLPWLEPDPRKPEAPSGLFLPVPLDAQVDDDGQIHPLELLWHENGCSSVTQLPCLPVSPVPATKKHRLGWWRTQQFASYLAGGRGAVFTPLPDSAFWEPEHRIGVEIAPHTFAAAQGHLYAGTYLRPRNEFRLAAWIGLVRPRADEEARFDRLITRHRFLLLGGERRLARITPRDGFTLPERPTAPKAGPCLLKWSLITPAVFVHGWLPGWCMDTSAQQRPAGEVCLKLPGRARLVASCLGKAVAFAGWDAVDGKPKETRLAVPAGSVYYFLCENSETANALIAKLHCDLPASTSGPRSDFFGEKGFGCGLCSLEVKTHATSADVPALAKELFNL